MCLPELGSFVKGSVLSSNTSPVLARIDQFCHVYLQQVILNIFPCVLRDILEMQTDSWPTHKRTKEERKVHLFTIICILLQYVPNFLITGWDSEM